MVLARNNVGNSLGAFGALTQELGEGFIQSSSLCGTDMHISMQSDFMAQCTAGLECCMQSDSIHGFIINPHISDVNVTFTSAYCPIICRTVPLVILVMFGKTHIHYEHHFSVLLKLLPYQTWDEFEANFPGMTCDFSDAGELALRMPYSPSSMLPRKQWSWNDTTAFALSTLRGPSPESV